VTPAAAAEELAALLRVDFASFVRAAFAELHPQTPWAPAWHLEVVAAKLAAVRRRRIRRLVVNLPPRHAKSLVASVAFPAWCLGHEPGLEILCASYAQELADKLSRDCRRIVQSQWYRRVFATRLAPARQAMAEFETTAQGCRLATSVGGVVTGRGADIIVIDDPLKPEEALSDTRRRAANEWFDHTLYSRLNDKREGAIVLVMHRLHADDLTGHVLEEEEWDHVSLPALAEADETHMVEQVWGRERIRRRRGAALQEEREGLDVLARIRRTIGEYNFAGQYQQTPAPLGGGLVKASWFARWRDGELPPRFERIVLSWDTANKASELSDFSVCTVWGIIGRHLFLLEVVRERLDYPALKRRVKDEHRRWRPDVVLIEDRASGTQLLQELREEGMHAATGYRPQADKVMRLWAQTATIENGFVHLPEKAPWLSLYLDELTSFPYGRFDDQVDATAQMLDWVKQAGREDGIFALYRRLAAERKARQEG
jgi:predicted phage terminase large subunit-like protein